MANRKNSHRRRVRVAVLMVLCGAVFAAFFARLAWMQFVRADYYADKAAEASSASYTVTQHAARGAIVDSAGVVLARDTTVYDVYLRIPAPPGTDLRKTVKAIENLTGSKDVETQLAAFFAAASAGELPVVQGVGSDVLTSFYKADLVQSGAVRAAARGVRTWPNGTLLPHALGFTGPITAEQWPTARRRVQPLADAVQQRRGSIGGERRVVCAVAVQIEARHAGGGQDAAGLHIHDHRRPGTALPPGPGSLGGAQNLDLG